MSRQIRSETKCDDATQGPIAPDTPVYRLLLMLAESVAARLLPRTQQQDDNVQSTAKKRLSNERP